MRSNVNFCLPIRNAARVTALHAPAGKARRSNFDVRSVPGLLLLLTEQKFNTDWLGCALSLAVLLRYIAMLCGRHCVRHTRVNMKNLYNTSLIVIALVIAFPSNAKEGNPSFWLVTPFSQAVSKCSAYGPEMRQRLTNALASGKENTKGKFPENIWTLLGSANSSTESKDVSPDIKKACDGVIEMYRNPLFATHFRQAIVAQLVSPPALKCIIQQPTMAPKIREAWSRAFLRNGFELSERSIDETVENARPHIKSQKTETGPSISDCEQLANQFFSPDFDRKYGEKGFYDFFAKS